MLNGHKKAAAPGSSSTIRVLQLCQARISSYASGSSCSLRSSSALSRRRATSLASEAFSKASSEASSASPETSSVSSEASPSSGEASPSGRASRVSSSSSSSGTAAKLATRFSVPLVILMTVTPTVARPRTGIEEMCVLRIVPEVVIRRSSSSEVTLSVLTRLPVFSVIL